MQNLMLKTQTKPLRRNFWQWINYIFNRVDEDRLKEFGPDRTCAEWLLRNGAAVKFVGVKEFLKDYNSLPIEGTAFHIKEIDATDSSIMHYGFAHFKGCNYIDWIKFDKCTYIEDEALPQLSTLQETLQFLQVSSCRNVTAKGLKGLYSLKNMKTLLMYDLPYVKNLDDVLKEMKQALPQCNITYKKF